MVCCRAQKGASAIELHYSRSATWRTRSVGAHDLEANARLSVATSLISRQKGPHTSSLAEFCGFGSGVATTFWCWLDRNAGKPNHRYTSAFGLLRRSQKLKHSRSASAICSPATTNLTLDVQYQWHSQAILRIDSKWASYRWFEFFHRAMAISRW